MNLDPYFIRAAKARGVNRASLRRAGVVTRGSGPTKPGIHLNSRRCSTCGELTPTFRLVRISNRQPICQACRDKELS